MPFDLGASFNNFADWISTAPIIGGAAASPVWAALLLTAVAAIIAMAVYKVNLSDTIRSRRGARVLLYVFLAALGLTFLHYHAVKRTVGAGATREGYRDVVGLVENSRAAGSEYPVGVMPMGGGSAGIYNAGGVPVSMAPAYAPTAGMAAYAPAVGASTAGMAAYAPAVGVSPARVPPAGAPPAGAPAAGAPPPVYNLATALAGPSAPAGTVGGCASCDDAADAGDRRGPDEPRSLFVKVPDVFNH